METVGATLSRKGNKLLSRRGHGKMSGHGRLWHFRMTSEVFWARRERSSTSQLGGARENLSWQSHCCLHVGDMMVICTYEFYNTSTIQGLDSFQHFCGEYL